MNVNFTAINVGNTRTQVGAFRDGTLAQSWVSRNDQPDSLDEHMSRAHGLVGGCSDPCVMLASVDLEAEPKVVATISKHFSTPLYRVGCDMKVPIGVQLDPETIVGVDRLLNAAAAYDVLRQACVVVDAGTAITVDFIDGAGTFHGGAIAPGAQMMLDSLSRGTSGLPELRAAKPDEPVGHSTSQAMLSAMFYGIRGMVRELVEQYARVAGSYPTVIATGGDAEMLFTDYDLIEQVVKDLTLIGMAVTLQSEMRTKP